METSFTRMRSQGRVVIPQSIREDLGLKGGTLLSVTVRNGAVVLKRLKRVTTKSSKT